MIRSLQIISILLMLTGCISVFEYAEPIDPESGWPMYLNEVDSLQPTLTWEADYDGPSDLVLFEGPGDQLSWVNKGPLVERVLVLTESGIQGNTYKVKEPLKPSTLYFWAVREHSAVDKTNWSNYDHYFFNVVIFGYYKGLPFGFKTPKSQ